MFCPNCGSKAEEDAYFCGECGCCLQEMDIEKEEVWEEQGQYINFDNGKK